MRSTWFMRVATTGFALLLALATTARHAQAQTGKLQGVVTDSASGQPIEGAQIVLQGTGYGTITQANGRYFLLALPPGNYTVIARRIGYQTQQARLNVAIDVTREQNFRLTAANNTLTAVKIVESAQPLVEVRQTGTTQQITAAELEALPVRSIKDAITLQSGFQEIPSVSTDLVSFNQSRRSGQPAILIRGGRNGETQTLIDDIPVNNILFGGQTLEVTQKAVSSIATFKGGLEPKYGNALSGIISIATKEGGENLAGSLNYETSRFGGELGNTQDKLRGYDFVEGFISGPVPATANKLRFLAAGRTQNQAHSVLEFDNQIYNPFQRDTVRRQPYSEDLIAGWRALGYDAERDMFGKLTFLFTPTTRLSVAAIDYSDESLNIPFDWMLTGFSTADACVRTYIDKYGSNVDVRDVCNTAYSTDRLNTFGRPLGSARNGIVTPAPVAERRDLYTVKFDQTHGRLNYRLVGGVLDQSRVTCATYFSGLCLGERIADTNFNGRFVTAGVTAPDITPTEGTDRISGNDAEKTRIFRGDAQLQATDHHNLAAGIFYQKHHVSFREVRDVGLNNIVLQPTDYDAHPWDAAAYLQDRIEYDFLTIKLGARFDYGRAGGKFFKDPLDPTNGTTQADVCADPARFGVPEWTYTDPSTGTTVTGVTACGATKALYDSSVAVAFRDDMGEASLRKAFSPRLSVGFPVGERSNVFFNYGVYYQNPLYNNVYQGTGIGTPLEGSREGPQLRNGTFVGNPQLRAEQTTSYEMGYVSEFGRNFSVQIVAFSKDQSGLTGIRQGGYKKGTQNRVFDPGVTYASTNTPSYTILVNQDYQTVRGFEIEFKRRLANFWRGTINYGYSQASNNAAPPDLEDQQVNTEGDTPARSEIRADIDQNHTLNSTLAFEVNENTPKIPLGRFLRNASLSTTLRVNSGYPYTPQLDFTGNSTARLERNSGTAPTTMRVDLQASKDWWLSNVKYGMFLRVVNLLDRKNCSQVFASTGNCDGGASPQARLAAGNFTGESEGSTFYDRPQYISTRRTVNAGVRVTF